MEEDASLLEESSLWKCKKHPFRRDSYGVCPGCLRDRLLLLCPNCARLRPCRCLSYPSSAFDPPRSSVGSVGRVAILIDGEPAFRRSRSASVSFLRQRPDATEVESRRGGNILSALWPFSKGAARREEEAAASGNFGRSKSAAVRGYSDSGVGDERREARVKGRNWHFPNPINAFWHSKSAKVVQERSSTFCRA